MADDPVIDTLPGQGFGAMSREQLLALTNNPRSAPIDPERGGMGGDPMGGHLKASQITPAMLKALSIASPATTNTISLFVGQKVYHRKRKQEGIIQSISADHSKVVIERDDGTTYNANVSNITALD